ncbi:MAG TPA: hypothetical protein VF775_01020 [Geobacteraceae bacterium]
MKVAIAGAGMAGAYLYRLLKKRGREADLFDHDRERRCGLTPCAWGTSSDFVGLVAEAGLDPERYILRRLDHVWMDDVRVAAELITFDKPLLIRDLLAGAEVRCAPLPVRDYDRVIDATGASRAFLPPVSDDIVMECRQYLVETDEPLENRIRLGSIGYAWCFPLSLTRYHVGCGSLLADPQCILEQLGWLVSTSTRHERRIVCSCTGTIRLTGPHGSLPFVIGGPSKGVWGVGEAIGCVAPLAGDGIVPGMRSVQLLLEKWEEPEGYKEAVLDQFRWMKDERGVVDSLRKGDRVGLRDARVLRRNARRMGMAVGLRDAFILLKNLR